MAECLKVIEIQKKILIFAGLWPEIEQRYLYKMMEVASWFSSIFITVCLYLEIINCLNSYSAFSEILINAVSVTTFLFKIVIFRVKSNRLQALLKILEDPEFSSNKVIIQKTTKFMRYMTICYMSPSAITVMILLVKPFFGIGNYPLRFSYNLGKFGTIFYFIQSISIIVIVVVYLTVELTIVGFMAIAGMEFEILSESVKKYHVISFNTIDEKIKWEAEITFQHFAKYHVKIIQFVDIIQDIFSHIFLVQFLDGVSCMCNIAFLLTHASIENIQFYVMCGYFCAKIQQVALYCWFGNEIILQSLQIRDACFESQWQHLGPRVKKIIFLIMERTKKPCRLTAGNFSSLSLTALMKILHTSYSYFALMQRLYRNSVEDK